MEMDISPLAPKSFPELPAVEGVKLAAKHAGIRYRNKDKLDLTLITLAEGTSVAGVFTTSKTASANIQWGRDALTSGTARALIVNSGNANAFNGRNGEDSVERIVEATTKLLDCDRKEVYPCATGVIGEPLADDKITDALVSLHDELSDDAWEGAAKAITTTDTYHKMATRNAMIGNTSVTINGIAKGSGMIAPDMATMLAYVFTDAKIPSSVLQELLSEYTEASFNSITVDSDTSTSDTLLMFATGTSEHQQVASQDDEHLRDFKAQLLDLLIELAHLIVRDGEGATKFVTVDVTGAVSDSAAKNIGMAIANSPLVKTAIAGEDPNWGRIVMAVGKSGEEADRDRLTVSIGNQVLAKDGQLNPDYVEAEAAQYMKGQEITIAVDIGLGNGTSRVWTCDLTHNYITINADYRS